MILVGLVACALLQPAPDQPVELMRSFLKGQKSGYKVASQLTIEERAGSLNTFIPETLEIEYAFTTEVLSLETDGIAKVRYIRPTITEIEGETFDSPPKRKVEKLDQNVVLTVSPINEILDIKETKPVPPAKPGAPARKPGGNARWMSASVPEAIQSPIDRFVGEVYRLALFIGPLDSSLDFSPKLPLDEVKVGDTWRKTVSYQPQYLAGTDKKAVQRLDYVYTYEGQKQVNGRTVVRVSGVLELKTDIGVFINQMLGMEPERSGLKAVPLEVKGKIDFDLDPKTLQTWTATGITEGGYKVQLARSAADEYVVESRFKGTSVLRKTS